MGITVVSVRITAVLPRIYRCPHLHAALYLTQLVVIAATRQINRRKNTSRSDKIRSL